jgi:hypothetical protein
MPALTITHHKEFDPCYTHSMGEGHLWLWKPWWRNPNVPKRMCTSWDQWKMFWYLRFQACTVSLVNVTICMGQMDCSMRRDVMNKSALAAHEGRWISFKNSTLSTRMVCYMDCLVKEATEIRMHVGTGFTLSRSWNPTTSILQQSKDSKQQWRKDQQQLLFISMGMRLCIWTAAI